MKKGIVLLCLLVCIGSLVGFLFSTKLVENSENHGAAKVDKKNDIVGKMDEVSNLDKFEQFLNHVKSGQADQVRIVNYTDEGDPIFQTLDYDGTNINYIFDDSNDKFGGIHKGKKRDVCRGIMKEESNEGISYKLSECKENHEYIGYFLLKAPNE
ncbi:DUF4362 domain-containing protein [Bacillus sp. DX1.1]|uniref:DUF4362 domain-containing protein n=1 Tax=unclassified Bacillus (in: firmicutes) TaxID=185979 RepID=UPI00256FDAD0|nr:MULTISPECIES: DUF4362 domain-containing protein [unclassified Bacillus (in: firmicutes)]MDM5157232.1 DUF4362 domain-containing protein [Bacillus sp. DX1.1]WJE81463.1 DUF4362 domain-containing protein [Bacillus sp. DX3.1]